MIDRQCPLCSEVDCEHKPYVHFNALTPAEAERLSLLAEECAEVIVAVEKIKRHGYESWNPEDPTRRSNRESLAMEMGDVQSVIELMVGKGDVSQVRILTARDVKTVTVKRWMHHQK